MSFSENSDFLHEVVQNLGLSTFSSTLVDLDPISEGSSSISSVTSSFISQQYPGASNHSPTRYNPSHNRSIESQLSQRDLVIDSIRQQHREQLDALHEKLQETDKSIRFIKEKFEEKIRTMNKRFQNEREELESQSQAEIKRLKDLNRAHRQKLMFNQLSQLTKEEYGQLTQQPITELSLPQFLAVELYKEREGAKEQLENLQIEKEQLEKANMNLKSQLAQTNSQAELIKSLESQLAASSKKIAPRPSQYEPVDQSEKIRKLDNERSELRSAYQVALARLNDANESKEAITRSKKETETELKQARSEIVSLKAQLKAVQTLAERQEGILQQQYNDIAELKQSRDEFFNRFIQSSENRKSEIGNLLKSEVERLSERSRNDVEFIRGVSEKMREREIQIIQQAHDNAIEESKQLRLDLRKAEEERSKLQAEYQTLQLAHEAEITRISSDLRVKSYELERVKLVYDELKMANEDVVDDRDALAAKFDLLKQEVMRLEHEVKMRDAQIQTLSDKVLMYERLENELDVAIETLDLNSVGPLAVPSDANRRVKQSVMLARRVMQLTATNNQLSAECESLRTQLTNNTTEMDDMKKQIQASGQPQQVFVQMLNEKQQEIAKLKTKVASLTEMNQQLLREKDSLQRNVQIVSKNNDDYNSAKKSYNCAFSKSYDEPPTKDCVDPAPFIITRNG